MATYTKYTKKDGSTNWKFQAYLGIDPLTGKEKRTTKRGFKTKKEATLAHSRLQLQVSQNGFSTSSSADYTFQEVYDLWILRYKQTVKESTFNKTIRIFENHILPEFSQMKINLIKISHCQDAVSTWSTKLRNYKLINNYAGLVFKHAVSLSFINTDPTRKIMMPVTQKMNDGDKNKFKFLEKEELNDFLTIMREEAKLTKSLQWHTLFRLLAYSGMRRGEALALCWSDLDFDNRTIDINKTLTRGQKNKLIIQTPKTEKSKRKISLDTDTLNLLRKWKKQQLEIQYKLGHDTRRTGQLIFSNSKNCWINPTKVGQTLDRIIKKHDLKRITPHGFRHTHCSLLFEAKLSIQEVQDRLGHGDVQTTMNVYTHISQHKKENAAQTFADFLKT